MGIICGLSVQAVALVIVNMCTNWDNEVSHSHTQSNTVNIVN